MPICQHQSINKLEFYLKDSRTNFLRITARKDTLHSMEVKILKILKFKLIINTIKIIKITKGVLRLFDKRILSPQIIRVTTKRKEGK